MALFKGHTKAGTAKSASPGSKKFLCVLALPLHTVLDHELEVSSRSLTGRSFEPMSSASLSASATTAAATSSSTMMVNLPTEGDAGKQFLSLRTQEMNCEFDPELSYACVSVGRGRLFSGTCLQRTDRWPTPSVAQYTDMCGLLLMLPLCPTTTTRCFRHPHNAGATPKTSKRRSNASPCCSRRPSGSLSPTSTLKSRCVRACVCASVRLRTVASLSPVSSSPTQVARVRARACVCVTTAIDRLRLQAISVFWPHENTVASRTVQSAAEQLLQEVPHELEAHLRFRPVLQGWGLRNGDGMVGARVVCVGTAACCCGARVAPNCSHARHARKVLIAPL